MYLLLTVYSMRRHTSKMHYKEDDLVTIQLYLLNTSKKNTSFLMGLLCAPP